MRTPSRPDPASSYEHPAFEGLYLRALRDVVDRRLAFLLREQLVTERVVTDVLTALHGSLDVSKVVRTLLPGLRDALGDSEKIAEWTRAAADRALAEGELPSFVTAARILLELRDYDGTVPARWRVSMLRAVDVPELTPRVLMFVRAYASRFPSESWPWVRRARRRSMVVILRLRTTVAEMQEAREL